MTRQVARHLPLIIFGEKKVFNDACGGVGVGGASLMIPHGEKGRGRSDVTVQMLPFISSSSWQMFKYVHPKHQCVHMVKL